MKTKQVLSTINIFCWIVFIGLCIKAGTIIFSFFVSLFVNHQAAENLYLFMNLSHLYDYSLQHYILVVSFIILITLLKTYMFYLVIKAFKAIDYENPFSVFVSRIVSTISSYAIYVSVIAIVAQIHTIWLANQPVFVPINWGATELIFMAGVVYIISFLFKRATEIQSENELTI